MRKFWLSIFIALLGLAAPKLQGAALFYYTYSAFETGLNTGVRQGYVHLYSIFPNTDCYLYTTSTSSATGPVDISTGPVYTSLGMADGQPFDPVIQDPPAPLTGYGDHYFMLKSNHPMIWELGGDISGGSAQDRDTFIISDNATFRGTRFFTHLDWDQAMTADVTLPVAGDIIIVWNPNAFPIQVSIARWTGVSNNYTTLVTQTIDARSAWQTGGTMPWEIIGAQGTDQTHSTHYRITSNDEMLVSRGNFFDSDQDNAWTGGPAWDTGLKVGTELYGQTGALGPSANIVVTDASGSANSYDIYRYVPNGLAPLGNYIIGNTSSGSWTLVTSRVVAANATDAYLNGAAVSLYKIVAAKPVQLQIGYRIASTNQYSNADWFTGISGANEPLASDFRFRMGSGNWINCIAPQAGTAITLQRVSDAVAEITGRGSSLWGPNPSLVIAATNSDTQTTTVPNQAVSWRLQSGNAPGQYRVTSSKQIYTFAGAIGSSGAVEKYYSAPVPKVVFSQLNMVKTVSKSQAYPNDVLTYTINFTNAGNTTLTAVNMWDPIPANTTYITGSATSSPAANSTTFAGNQLNWFYSSLSAGAKGVLTFQVRISSSVAIGTYINNTMQGQDDGTFMPGPGSSNVAKTLIIKPLVSVTKANSPTGAISLGDTLTYNLAYENTGTTWATGVFICDTIPAGTSIVPSSQTSSPSFPYTLSGNLLCWNLGTVKSQYTNLAVTLSAGTVATSTGMTNPNSVLACDGSAASVTGKTNGSEVVSLTSFSFPAGAIITSVAIKARWWSSKYFHTLGLNFSTDGTNPTTPLNSFGATTATSPGAYSIMDISSLRAWTPALVNAIKVYASFTYVGSPNNQEDADLDCVTVLVNYRVLSGDVYSGTLSFQIVPSQCNFTINNTAKESDQQSSGSSSNLVSNDVGGCTPTNTPTRSYTFTPSPTFSSTPTPTGTPTWTPTATQSATPSPTSTWTPTSTPTPTYTNSPTPTGTPTNTPTPTQSFTFTNSPTPTWTPTATPTNTPTATFTPTPTSSDSPTVTPSGTPTFSFTPTQSFTFTPTASNSATPTSTFSGTTTFTNSPSASPTVTQSYTFTGSNTFTDSPTASPTASPTYSFTGSNTFTYSPTASPTVTESFTFTATKSFSFTPTVTDTYTDTATQTQTSTFSPTRSATPTKSVTFTFSASPTYSPSPTISPTFTPSAPFLVAIKVFNSAGELVATLNSALPLFSQMSGVDLLQGTLDPDLGGQGLIKLVGPDVMVSWSGTGSNGQYVASGSYFVLVQQTDPTGAVSSWTSPMSVIRSETGVEIEVYNAAGELVWHRSKPLNGSSRMAVSSDRLVLGSTPAGSLKISYGGGAADFVTWDGTNSAGLQVTTGTYIVRLTRKNALESKQYFSKTVSVIRIKSEAFDKVAVWPNPVTADDKTVTIGFVNARPGCAAWAEVYGLSGERVASLRGSTDSGLSWTPRSGQAAGIYLIRLSVQTPEGVLHHRTLKLSLLR